MVEHSTQQDTSITPWGQHWLESKDLLQLGACLCLKHTLLPGELRCEFLLRMDLFRVQASPALQACLFIFYLRC